MVLPEAELPELPLAPELEVPPLDPERLLSPPIIPQPLASASPATVTTVPSTFSIATLLVG